MADRQGAKPRSSAPGVWAQLIAEAINICQRRAGISGRELCERAGMSYPTFASRTAARAGTSVRAAFTLNEIERIAPVLGVTPLEISHLAATIGELTPTETQGVNA